MKDISGKKVAILITHGFEQSEFEQPYNALIEAGAYVDVISLETGKVRGWDKDNWGNEVNADKAVDSVSAQDYDALVLPGGVMSPDKLRMNEQAVAFAGGFFEDNKPVSAICHGPWTLIETGELKGRTVTSYPSLKTDLTNAGANWVDEEVVVDNGLVTSRTPKDLPAFIKKMLEEIKEGAHIRTLILLLFTVFMISCNGGEMHDSEDAGTDTMATDQAYEPTPTDKMDTTNDTLMGDNTQENY